MEFHPGSSKNDNRQTKLVIKKLLKAFNVDRWNVSGGENAILAQLRLAKFDSFASLSSCSTIALANFKLICLLYSTVCKFTKFMHSSLAFGNLPQNTHTHSVFNEISAKLSFSQNKTNAFYQFFEAFDRIYLMHALLLTVAGHSIAIRTKTCVRTWII